MPVHCLGQALCLTFFNLLHNVLVLYPTIKFDNFVFLNLSSGVYQIVVKKKGSNCILNYSNPITLIAPEAPQIVSLEIKQPECGSNFGSIACSASKPNVEYSIDGINWQGNPVFNNLPAGEYTLRIRNGDGSCENIYDELVL